MTPPITVVIASRNRPLYLWACLDALYRNTRTARRFVLIDMGSTDPLVFDIIAGFERRNMFSDVIKLPRNDPAALMQIVFNSMPTWGPFFGYIESDVVVEAGKICWLGCMTELMNNNPRLAMLGSTIDKLDFVDPDDFPSLRQSLGEERWAAIIKINSPERRQDVASAAGEPLFRPHNPPGRLLLLRAEALGQVGLMHDGQMNLALREQGWDTALATQVRHRHLSLIQAFDYPDYDLDARNHFMAARHAVD